MPITTADWIRYVESLGPADSQSVQMRLRSAGLDVERAGWIASMIRRRERARTIGSIAAFVTAAGIAWLAYYFWLAITGDPAAPGIVDTWKPGAVAGVGSIAMMIATSVELNRPIDLLAHDEVPAGLRPPPRAASVVPLRGVALRLAAAVIALGLGFFSLIIPEIRNHVWLRKSGVETRAEVTRLYTMKGSKGKTRYLVEYRVDGEVASRTVDAARFRSLKTGDAIAVTYLPSRPEISMLRTKREVDTGLLGDRGLILPVVFPLVMLPSVAILVAFSRGRYRKLAERGIATVGAVTGAHFNNVMYAFDTPHGMQTGRFHHGKRRLRQRPEEGQPLVILYDPATPSRNVPLGALSDMELGA